MCVSRSHNSPTEMCVYIYWLIPKRKASIAMPSVELSLWNWVPPEVEFPVETAPCHVRASDVLKRLVTNHVNDWRHN